MRPAVSSRRRAPVQDRPDGQSHRAGPRGRGRKSITSEITPLGPGGAAGASGHIGVRQRTKMADDLSMNPSRDDFEALLDESMAAGDFAEGSVVKGLVVAIEKDFAIIDV